MLFSENFYVFVTLQHLKTPCIPVEQGESSMHMLKSLCDQGCYSYSFCNFF